MLQEKSINHLSLNFFHVGTNSLANYFYADRPVQPRDQILNHQVQLADIMREAYNNETLVAVSAVLPRIDSPDLLDLVCTYMLLRQRLAILGDEVAFLDWDGVFSQDKDYLYNDLC